MKTDNELLAAAGVCLLLFLLVGLRAVRGPLSAVDARGVYLSGHFTRLALLFTRSGRAIPLTAGYGAMILIYAYVRWHVTIPAALAACQIASQFVAELLKAFYRRVRPDYWIVRMDPGSSFPSGHAATAVVTFVGWAVIAASSRIPTGARDGLIAVLILWALGIMWSRLELGAHYVSDVVGGALFGSAWLFALLSIFGRW